MALKVGRQPVEFSVPDIAAIVQQALAADAWVPKTVTVKAQAGSIILEGQVAWNFQRDAAERTTYDLRSVGKVHNNIVVEAQARDRQVRGSV